jgi:hypothetical protein
MSVELVKYETDQNQCRYDGAVATTANNKASRKRSRAPPARYILSRAFLSLDAHGIAAVFPEPKDAPLQLGTIRHTRKAL